VYRDVAGLRRLAQSLQENHPPLSLDSADLTVHDPDSVRVRYGRVFAYLSRVELEVERNVLELRTLLPDAPETDRFFFEDVWAPQELQHGVLLDAAQRGIGLPSSATDVDGISVKIRAAGALSHLPGVAVVLRLLYYLTGTATERAAVVAYSRLHDGLREMGERAIADTVIAPIRRQEPGHFAFYRRSAEVLVHEEGLRPWQLHLARVLRRSSFDLVGVNDAAQRADFGDVARDLGLDRDRLGTARQLSLVERELLWSRDQGLRIPDYVLRALDDALELSRVRECAARRSTRSADVEAVR
jgi:hypothetical protein